MTTEVVALRESATTAEALALLAQHRIANLPVVDESGRVVGVVGEVDLLRARGDPHRQGDCVALLLRPNPITVPPDMDVEVASDLLTCAPIRSLPVVEDERLVGVVSRSDVLRALSRRVRG